MKFKIMIKKLVYIPLFVLLTPFMGIIGFFGYIISLWQGWWKWDIK